MKILNRFVFIFPRLSQRRVDHLLANPLLRSCCPESPPTPLAVFHHWRHSHCHGGIREVYFSNQLKQIVTDINGEKSELSIEKQYSSHSSSSTNQSTDLRTTISDGNWISNINSRLQIRSVEHFKPLRTNQ